jgi:hypothetical protein
VGVGLGVSDHAEESFLSVKGAEGNEESEEEAAHKWIWDSLRDAACTACGETPQLYYAGTRVFGVGESWKGTCFRSVATTEFGE